MRGPRLVSAALLACLALTACQKDPVGPVDPDDTATPSATATPTPTGPTAPVMPEAARANTARGATAFTEYYIDLLDLAATTGDTTPLRRASKGCGGCNNYARLYESTYAAGGYIRRSQWVLVAPFADISVEPAVVLTDISAPPTRFKRRSSDQEQTGPAETYKLRFELSWSKSSWVVTQLAQQATAP